MKLWTGIITDRVAESRDFYLRLFDFKVIYAGDDDWFVLLQLGDSEIGFMRPELETQAPVFRKKYQNGGAWITIDVADAAAEQQRIQALGIPIEQALRDEAWGEQHFVIIDPNGVPIDIVQRDRATMS